jgi:hypothetical protein
LLDDSREQGAEVLKCVWHQLESAVDVDAGAWAYLIELSRRLEEGGPVLGRVRDLRPRSASVLVPYVKPLQDLVEVLTKYRSDAKRRAAGYGLRHELVRLGLVDPPSFVDIRPLWRPRESAGVRSSLLLLMGRAAARADGRSSEAVEFLLRTKRYVKSRSPP